jgi:hypothetical protein
MFNLSHHILESLLIKAYNNFKKENPGEEPWWRITCMRKHYKSKYNIKPGDENIPWRKIIYDDSEDKKAIIKTISADSPLESAVKIKKAKIRKTRNVYKNSEGVKHMTQWVKDEPEFSTEIHQIPVDNLGVMAAHYDVVYRNDEPTEIEVVNKDDTLVVWGIDKNKFIKPVITDGVKCNLLNFTEVEKIQNELNQVKDELNKAKDELASLKKNPLNIKEFHEENAKLQSEIKQIQEDNKLFDEELKKLQSSIKANLSIKDVIVKYGQIQRKLNDCKQVVDRIVKYFDDDEFDYKKNLDDYGFIMTMARLFDYQMSIIRRMDDYDSEYYDI